VAHPSLDEPAKNLSENLGYSDMNKSTSSAAKSLKYHGACPKFKTFAMLSIARLLAALAPVPAWQLS
jgi:hypothetical protein